MSTSIRVLPSEAGLRLDRLLTARLPELGRRAAREAFSKGRVTIAGRRVKKSDPARPGDEITLELEPERVEPEPELGLDVRFECAAFVVVSKPAGMMCRTRKSSRGFLARSTTCFRRSNSSTTHSCSTTVWRPSPSALSRSLRTALS